MNDIRIEIDFADGVDANLFDEITALAHRCVNAALGMMDIKLHPNAELSLLIAGDDTLKGLNKEWRGKDRPTNVLSFPVFSSATMPAIPLAMAPFASGSWVHR